MASRGVGVQSVILAAGAFVVGLVIGGLGPRGEVRELEQKVFELEKSRTRGTATQATELARLIATGIDGGGAASPAPVDGAAGPEGEPAVGSGDADLVAGEPDPERDPFEAAREVLELRRTQARAALVEDVDPTGVQLDEIDRVVARMNAELEQIARSFVDEVGVGVEPSRRELMSAGADALDTLANAEEQLLRVLTPEQRDAVRQEATDPTAYVDPNVLAILAPLAPEVRVER